MSAFNWIVVHARCPSCGQQTEIRCQTHVASTYAGDARGRFHDREYNLGEKMFWWPETDARSLEWRANASLRESGDDYEDEACYATCSACRAALCAVVRFRGACPERLLGVTTEENWPAGYER